jgi:hypothetical protein
MADRVFCIDFGSSYTKVALRRDPGADAEAIRTGFSISDVPDFCFPSAVGVERRGNRNAAVCGPAAMQRRHDGGLHVNWKRKVFAPADGAQPPRKPPLDAFLESPELVDLATKHGVTSAQLVHLQNVVASARALAGGPGSPPVSPDAQNRATAGALAFAFFQWLRDEVMKAAQRLRLDGLDPAAIPARITVPALAQGKELEQHPGCQLLLHALERAGWRLHPDRPIVPEPYANAIGVLTGGTNVVHKGRLQFRKMFGNGPAIRVLGDAAHYPAYRALVVDVGAFTTDFAAITLHPDGKADDEAEPPFAVRQHSVTVGVSNLDGHVFAALPQAKSEWLTKAAEPVTLEGFRRAVYTDGKAYRTVEVGPIGGATDADAIRDGMDAFLGQLAVEATKFCDDLEPVPLQELILTGGGVSIPRAREALIGAAKCGGREFVKTHAPGLKRGTADGLVHPLKEDMARGASALGGASIYYERDYY